VPAAILLGVLSVLWFAYPKAGHRAAR
jgi:hypothetical protein